ncbi:hypothetical protein [Arthrobacter rhombi]|uniref:hypothetical protein n=1 Tax=Arthrobacter rhombi TaxID=71253 RepID=UPI003FD3657D
MNHKITWLFPGAILAFALAAAVLILTIPALFGAHEPYQTWLTSSLAVLTTLLGTAVILLRPPRWK